MTHIIYSQLPLTDSFGLPLRINGMHRTQSDLMRIWTFYLLQSNHTGFDLLSRNAPIFCRAGGEARHGVGVGPGVAVGHLTDLVLLGEGIFESFFTWHGDIWPLTQTKETDTDQTFLLHACTVQSGSHEGHRWGWKQGKLEWIWLFCLHILFYLGNLTEN